ADAARERALKEQATAEQAKQAAARAELEKTELRARLINQLNLILETRDTARGLVVNISDVLFDTGQYTLKPLAREKLAKVSEIVVGNTGWKLKVEGHTDNVGVDKLISSCLKSVPLRYETFWYSKASRLTRSLLGVTVKQCRWPQTIRLPAG